ncbi:MAG: hypothetical protein ACXVWF_01330 [Actinomycetota bacterium]
MQTSERAEAQIVEIHSGLDRSAWDRIVSAAAVVVAVVFILAGAAAVYGGNFARNNVRDRLAPEQVFFAPYSQMSAEEQATLGQYAGQQVTTGPQAEAFAQYIAGHLAFINDGKTYAETSAAARAKGLDAQTAADLQTKADTLFKGETLRSIMLNAYAWWTVATIALYVGFGLIGAGIVLAVLAFFGVRHARKATA